MKWIHFKSLPFHGVLKWSPSLCPKTKSKVKTQKETDWLEKKVFIDGHCHAPTPLNKWHTDTIMHAPQGMQIIILMNCIQSHTDTLDCISPRYSVKLDCNNVFTRKKSNLQKKEQSACLSIIAHCLFCVS